MDDVLEQEMAALTYQDKILEIEWKEAQLYPEEEDDLGGEAGEGFVDSFTVKMKEHGGLKMETGNDQEEKIYKHSALPPPMALSAFFPSSKKASPVASSSSAETK
eukprot:Awhi_evm1s8517